MSDRSPVSLRLHTLSCLAAALAVLLAAGGCPPAASDPFAVVAGGGVTNESTGAEESDPIATGDGAAASDNAILVSIVMHCEEPPGYPDFVADAATFAEHRAAVLRFATMLAGYGVAFDYQSDWNFLQAIGLHDRGDQTGGKNILRYLKEDLGFAIDPHAHETTYNYADVAYLAQQLGVTPSNVVGGFIIDPPRDSKLEQFWQPIVGAQYPGYTWSAAILWGGGTGNHVNESSFWTSGVWRPSDRGHFLTHSDAGPLPNIGNFGGTWEGLDLLLRLHADGKLSDGIHTCTVMTNQRDVVEAGFIESFEAELAKRADHPAIRWVTLTEVIEIWQSEYRGVANQLSYNDALTR